MTDRAGNKTNTDNKIYSRTCRVKPMLSRKLRRASYTMTNLAGLVSPLRFQNPSALIFPFTAND
jgi:hypothetical protein